MAQVRESSLFFANVVNGADRLLEALANRNGAAPGALLDTPARSKKRGANSAPLSFGSLRHTALNEECG
ncbi:MAG: hypothetical protein CMJ89_10520 [Planctomycetes bacterium]|nr:hypothetical protein [Planctomycetota bacterium]